MHSRLQIVANEENKTLTLGLAHHLPDGELIAPYIAMDLYNNQEYRWTNYEDWLGTEVNIDTLINKTSRVFWEYYKDNVIIAYSEFDLETDLVEIIEQWGYLPNYILSAEVGELTLKEVEDEENTFGEGKYYVMANPGEGVEYKGQYLRCIADIKENRKSGAINKEDQLIFIPLGI